MSLHYLLDGNNIIHQIPKLALKKFEDQRRAFVQWIEIRRPQGSLKNRVTVIFDGRPGRDGSIQSSIVEVKFSGDDSADNVIRHFVEESAGKKNIIVVTNDRDIKYSVRKEGAAVWSVEEFMAKLESSTKTREERRVTGSPSAGKAITKVMEHEINVEFEKIWLKEKDKKA